MLCQTIKQWATENDEDDHSARELLARYEDVSQLIRSFLFSRTRKGPIVKLEQLHGFSSSTSLTISTGREKDLARGWFPSTAKTRCSSKVAGAYICMWVLADHEYGIHIYRVSASSSSVPFCG